MDVSSPGMLGATIVLVVLIFIIVMAMTGNFDFIMYELLPCLKSLGTNC